MSSRQFEIYEKHLKKIGKEVVIPKGTRLPSENIYYLIEGVSALTCLTPSGEESSYIFFKQGMLLNFLPILIHTTGLEIDITRRRFSKINHTIYTKTRCRFICIPGEVFLDYLEKNPALYMILVRSLTENMVNLLALSTEIVSKSASARVCQVILDIMSDDEEPVIPRFLTYTEIAFYLSMHEITVAKIFKALRRDNIIKKSGRSSVVVDVDTLTQIADGAIDLHYKN